MAIVKWIEWKQRNRFHKWKRLVASPPLSFTFKWSTDKLSSRHWSTYRSTKEIDVITRLYHFYVTFTELTVVLQIFKHKLKWKVWNDLNGWSRFDAPRWWCNHNCFLCFPRELLPAWSFTSELFQTIVKSINVSFKKLPLVCYNVQTVSRLSLRCSNRKLETSLRDPRWTNNSIHDITCAVLLPCSLIFPWKRKLYCFI